MEAAEYYDGIREERQIANHFSKESPCILTVKLEPKEQYKDVLKPLTLTFKDAYDGDCDKQFYWVWISPLDEEATDNIRWRKMCDLYVQVSYKYTNRRRGLTP